MTFLNTFFANLEHLTYLALLELFLPGPCNCTCEQHLEAPTSGNGWLEGQLVAPGRFQIHTETYLSSTLVTFPWRKIWFHICRLTLCSWPEKDSNFEWVLKSYSSMVSMGRLLFDENYLPNLLLRPGHLTKIIVWDRKLFSNSAKWRKLLSTNFLSGREECLLFEEKRISNNMLSALDHKHMRTYITTGIKNGRPNKKLNIQMN